MRKKKKVKLNVAKELVQLPYCLALLLIPAVTFCCVVHSLPRACVVQNPALNRGLTDRVQKSNDGGLKDFS